MDKNKIKKLNQAINMIEEISWIIENNPLKLKELPEILKYTMNIKETSSIVSDKYRSKNPNKDQLIGLLPNFLQDQELFKSNKDLVDFGENILKIKITRSEKRTRYELIGLIICDIRNLNDFELEKLVDALISLSNSEERLIDIKIKKNSNANFSWNDAIFELNNRY
ncbi:hypothetical protein [Flavobacterium sp. KBS0721]|uniref:hypothetical protein n=1 Tax=Flavobacterium sp. KBS0721 TaxID=1179672 RepID=UPI000F4DD59C|nr:hypothetical protein [Flavobacterium sp. KBS0721]QDW21664.1 hypothetical protein B0M43_0016610 [Flavobacterium sp. KBS0721]